MKFLATLLLFFTGTLNGQKARNYHVVTARLTAPAEKSIRRVLAQHNNGDVRYAAVGTAGDCRWGR